MTVAADFYMKHFAEVRAIAWHLAELFDVDRDGDDVWQLRTLEDGSTVFLYVTVETRKKRVVLTVSIFLRDETGRAIPSSRLRVYEETLSSKYNYNEEGDFT